MFRKYILRKRLRRLALLLFARYGKQDYYSVGQILKVIDLYKINNKDLLNYFLLFLNENDYNNETKKDDYQDSKKSLFIFLNKIVTEYDIKKNNFIKLLDIDLENGSNYHHTIGPNSDAMSGGYNVER